MCGFRQRLCDLTRYLSWIHSAWARGRTNNLRSALSLTPIWTNLTTPFRSNGLKHLRDNSCISRNFCVNLKVGMPVINCHPENRLFNVGHNNIHWSFWKLDKKPSPGVKGNTVFLCCQEPSPHPVYTLYNLLYFLNSPLNQPIALFFQEVL